MRQRVYIFSRVVKKLLHQTYENSFKGSVDRKTELTPLSGVIKISSFERNSDGFRRTEAPLNNTLASR